MNTNTNPIPTFEELTGTPPQNWYGVDLMDHVSNLAGAAAFLKLMADTQGVMTATDGVEPTPEALQRSVYDTLLPWMMRIAGIPVRPYPKSKVN